MRKNQYCVFDVKGGLGKNIAATAVAQCICNNFPDLKLIVVASWPDIWVHLPFVHRVYQHGNTRYFYQEYIEDKESIIFAGEPYFCSDHINKKLPLIETWCKHYNLNFNQEKPILVINPQQRRKIRHFYQFDKPIFLIHTNGGFYHREHPYSWARDMPHNVAVKISEHFSNDYQIVQVARQNSPHIENAFCIDNPIPNMELIGLLELTNKRFLIDSCLQHAAAALQLPSTVLWNATSPTIFGYSIHDNVETLYKPSIQLPNSYLFDYDFEGDSSEYPYTEDQEKNLYDIDYIINSLEKKLPMKKPFNQGFGKMTQKNKTNVPSEELEKYRRYIIATLTDDGKCDMFYVSALSEAIKVSITNNIVLIPIFYQTLGNKSLALNQALTLAWKEKVDGIIFIHSTAVNWTSEMLFDLITSDKNVVGLPVADADGFDLNLGAISQLHTDPKTEEIKVKQASIDFMYMSPYTIKKLCDTHPSIEFQNQEIKLVLQSGDIDSSYNSENIILQHRLQELSIETWINPKHTVFTRNTFTFNMDFGNLLTKLKNGEQK
jgi:hypothetical protein